MVGLTGFVVTVTVLAIQMATGTFSARYMRIWYRDNLLKATLAVLAGTLAFSFSLLRQVTSNQSPNIGVSVAGFLMVLSLVLFLLFFDRFIHRLRPVAFRDPGGAPRLLMPGRTWADHRHGHPESRGRQRIHPNRHRRSGAHGVKPAGRFDSGHQRARPGRLGQQA
jgi:hypothetical protein